MIATQVQLRPPRRLLAAPVAPHRMQVSKSMSLPSSLVPSTALEATARASHLLLDPDAAVALVQKSPAAR